MFNIFRKKNKIAEIHTSEEKDESLRKEQNLIYAKNVWENKIKVGDVVTIRSDLEDEQHFGQFTVAYYMVKYRGMNATVVKKTKPRKRELFSEILLDVDGKSHLWDVTMFENVISN